MEEKSSGIVVSSVSYGENDKILNIFTLDKGMISARIKGVKKAGAKLKFASEPFCFSEYVFLKSGEKRTVISASLIDSFYPIRESVEKFYSAGVFAEFIRAFSREEILSPELFMLFAKSLEGLAYGEDNPIYTAVKFLISACSFVGYGLNLDGCVKCDGELNGRTFFDYDSGGFYCEDCFDGKGREILCSTYQALKSVSDGLLPPLDDLKKALKLLNYYLKNKAEITLKSLDQLIEIVK